MKNTTKRFTRKIAAMLAAVTAMSAFAAVSASASDDENNEIIAAAKANAALQETWEDVENDPANEDEIDQVYDLLERLEITVDCFNGKDRNVYDGSNGKLTHGQVLEIIRSAHPDGCIRNPFNMGFDTDCDFDDDDSEPVFTEEDFENDGDGEDGGESYFDLDFNFDADLIDQILG